MRSDIVDVQVIYQHATDRAVCVRSDEKSTKDVWLPLSLVELDFLGKERRRGVVVEVSGPESLFEEKELI